MSEVTMVTVVESAVEELRRQEGRLDIKVGQLLSVAGVAAPVVVALGAAVGVLTPVARWYILLGVVPLLLSVVPFTVCLHILITQAIRATFQGQAKTESEPPTTWLGFPTRESQEMRPNNTIRPDRVEEYYEKVLRVRWAWLKDSVERKYGVVERACWWLLRGFAVLGSSVLVLLVLFISLTF